MRAELREFNGETDHVHLLVHYPPKIALSKLNNSLRSVSSRRLHAEYTSHINRSDMGLGVLVPLLLHRPLRQRNHDPPIHRRTETPYLTDQTETQRTPALRASAL
ncbi:transposase [Streptomyces sp. NPDC093982]|uniref:transposase n=1 Tax=Streptomyces sp. NPDC093982 TaxID=3155077 RepID=UPI00344ADECA